MTALEVAQKVATRRQALLVRERKGEPGRYDAKDLADGSKRGWVILDGWTASAIVRVYEALNQDNKKAFAAMSLIKMANVALKLIK